MNEIINKFFLDDDKLALGRDDINVELTHVQSLLFNVELLAIISDVKFYLDAVNIDFVSKDQIISDISSIIES